MLVAALLAGASALLGGWLALGARRWPAVLERTRTFAFAAAAGVVAFHLLPEVLRDQGLRALLFIAAGFLLPWALEALTRVVGPRLVRRDGISGARVAAEIGFAALVFHTMAEGVALVAAMASGGKPDLLVALVAHHAPLTAAVVLPFLELGGARSVAVRALIVGVTGVGGALLGQAVPGLSADGAALRLATAVTAGALLHVVADEIREAPLGTHRDRAADLGAFFLGLAVAGLGATLHVRELQATGPLLAFLLSLGNLALVSAVPLLAGLLVTRFLPWPRLDGPLLAASLLGPAAGALVLGLAVLSPSGERSVLHAARDRAPRVLVLWFIAAAIEVGAGSLTGAERAIVLGALFVAARLDEAGAVAVAAVLLRHGVPAPPVLGLFAAGAALHGLRGRAPVARVPGVVFAFAAGGAVSLVPRVVMALEPARSFGAQVVAHPIEAAALLALTALSLATLWQSGARSWFSPLRHRA